MSEVLTTPPPADLPAPPESRDYWDVVFGALAKRRSYRLGMALLTLLYGVAIFAPFLANDRPLRFEGTHYGAYRAAHRLIPLTAADLGAKLRQGEAGFAAWEAGEREKASGLQGEELQQWLDRQDAAPSSLEEWLEVDQTALGLRLAVLRRQLADEAHGLLDELKATSAEAVRAGIAGAEDELELALTALDNAASRVRDELRAARYDSAPEPGRSVALQPFTSYPILASLMPAEVGFMIFWLLVALLPLWGRAWDAWGLGGDRARIRVARRHKLAVVIALPLAGAALFALLFGSAGDDFETTTLKQALSEDTARASSVVFAPLPYGMAEQNDTEHFRGPTWDEAWEKDAEGYYAAAGLGDRVDPATGIPIHATPVEVRRGESDSNASARHMLGTDSLGRDMLARMCWGARISLSVGLVSTILLVFLGTLLGALAGYYPGLTDVVISRVIEIFQCFPVFFLILIVVSFLGPSILNIMLAIGLFRWTGVARLVRGEFLRLRHQEFVVASEALGVRSSRTIFRHVLPNAMGPVLVAATFAVASGILTESALSFLGFGVQLPIPSWGSLLVESRNPEYWWIQVFPGLAVFVTVMLYNLVGEAVRDALDPRLKEA